MITQAAQTVDGRSQPTIWGLNPAQLHDRFWAARGVQVVRQGQSVELVSDAELFLLIESQSMAMFRLGLLIDTLSWLKPKLVLARLRSTREHGYRELVITDENDRFLRFERVYGGGYDSRVSRVGLTPDAELARSWQEVSESPSTAWRGLRESVGRTKRLTVTIEGRIYDWSFDPEVMQFIRELVQLWGRPDTTIRRVRQMRDEVWIDSLAPTHPATRFIGPVWIGSGRDLEGIESVVGPAVLWDASDARPEVDRLQWEEIEPTADVFGRAIRARRLNRVHRVGKRLFDIVLAVLALALTLPIYPVVMLSIWLEDGRPYFFAHRRQTLGGREFLCLKFRTMRRDAEQLKAELAARNQADGPQFFIEDDPRLTRMGKWMRRFNIDELPQFLNVLVGHMSVVGPRPSPHSENQYCPAWRETRLSTRPGITGLWQVLRSRREGLDFQEWIRYDIQYVETMSWRLDLWLIWRTMLKLVGIKTKP